MNGKQTATGNLSESIDWGATTIGRNGGTVSSYIGKWYWEGSIAEIRIYNYALSDAERELVERELEEKWLSPPKPQPISAVHFTALPNLREGTENVAPGATVGTLSATDGIGEITYSLTAGPGDEDNGRFTIQGNAVKVGTTALTEGTYTFRVKGVDGEGNEAVGSFSVEVKGKPQLPKEGLVLHLDAEDYNASTGVWPDRSNVGNAVRQNDVSKRPGKVETGINERPAVSFNGNNQYLELQWNTDNGYLTTEEATIFLVLQSKNMNDSQTVMGNYDVDGAVCFHVSTNQKTLTATVSSRNNRIEFSGSLEPIIATYKVTSTNHTAYVNGKQTATGNLSESINWGATTIGRNGGTVSSYIGEWYWEGSIAEIRIYNYALSDAEREAVEKELYNKWFGSLPPRPIKDLLCTVTPNLLEGTSSVAEGAIVATLSAVYGIGDITYSLVAGDGDEHNHCFAIDGNTVRVAGEALAAGTYTFRVKGADGEGNAVEKSFSITVLDKNAPYLRVINNPYADVNWETVKQYKANFHTHTNQSDGNTGPAGVIEAYSNAGYSILVLTDHDSVGAVDTTWPWTKWISEKPSLINYRVDPSTDIEYETSAFYPDLGPGGMLAVRGNELSRIDNIGSLFNAYGGPAGGQEELALQEVEKRDGLAIIYHPGRYTRSLDWYIDLYTKYYKAPLIGMEVYNQGDRYSGDRAL